MHSLAERLFGSRHRLNNMALSDLVLKNPIPSSSQMASPDGLRRQMLRETQLVANLSLLGGMTLLFCVFGLSYVC